MGKTVGAHPCQVAGLKRPRETDEAAPASRKAVLQVHSHSGFIWLWLSDWMWKVLNCLRRDLNLSNSRESCNIGFTIYYFNCMELLEETAGGIINPTSGPSRLCETCVCEPDRAWILMEFYSGHGAQIGRNSCHTGLLLTVWPLDSQH